MKPLKLKMSAFGSYKDLVIVDFEIAGHGIFLITGDTGSGKTTIFDALSYALFGETSGHRRDPSMMRSQYADGDMETFAYQSSQKRDHKQHTNSLTHQYLSPSHPAIDHHYSWLIHSTVVAYYFHCLFVMQETLNQ